MELTLDVIKACKMTALSCRKCTTAFPIESEYHISFKQCEDICFALIQAASSNSPYIQKFIFLCIGLCEDCAELAEEKMEEDYFMEASAHCRNLSNMLINLIPAENSKIQM